MWRQRLRDIADLTFILWRLEPALWLGGCGVRCGSCIGKDHCYGITASVILLRKIITLGDRKKSTYLWRHLTPLFKATPWVLQGDGVECILQLLGWPFMSMLEEYWEKQALLCHPGRVNIWAHVKLSSQRQLCDLWLWHLIRGHSTSWERSGNHGEDDLGDNKLGMITPRMKSESVAEVVSQWWLLMIFFFFAK